MLASTMLVFQPNHTVRRGQYVGTNLYLPISCHTLQVLLSHRLGMANVFDPVRPSMHYKLRMWRADEHQVRPLHTWLLLS